MKQREIDQIKRPRFTKPEVRRGMAGLLMELPDGKGLDKLVADVNREREQPEPFCEFSGPCDEVKP